MGVGGGKSNGRRIHQTYLEDEKRKAKAAEKDAKHQEEQTDVGEHLHTQKRSRQSISGVMIRCADSSTHNVCFTLKIMRTNGPSVKLPLANRIHRINTCGPTMLINVIRRLYWRHIVGW